LDLGRFSDLDTTLFIPSIMSANEKPRLSRASLRLSALFPVVFALVALPLQLVTFLSGQSLNEYRLMSVCGYSLPDPAVRSRD